MICPEQLRNYVLKTGLKENDYLCKINLNSLNKELRCIGKKVLSQEQIQYKNLTSSVPTLRQQVVISDYDTMSNKE